MERMWDVAVIGYGPVGMAAAALLARDGHRVTVLERYSGLYNLPRAAIFDDETMRTFAKLGIAEAMLPRVHAQRTYEWRNGAGDLLIEHDFAARGRSGWAEWYMMYQPDLEDALDRTCREAGVAVRFGATVTAIRQDAEAVTLTVDGQAEPVRARFVLACDGGNSFARSALGIGMTDYGFSEPWMVCDFRLDGTRVPPMARQVCDPAQPISIISLGPGHHRFSFMLGAGEDPAVEREPARVWRRVAAYLRPDEATLIRAATYTFRSLVATAWRDGRVLLAGDAAHQMPPFLGQGMCSGIRDALNLHWKIGLALGGADPEPLLASYQTEREAHVEAITRKGIELGRVQTMRDPATAAERDRALLQKRRDKAETEKISWPPLGVGLFGGGVGAGELFPQADVRAGGRTGRFDAVAGYGYLALVRGKVARALPDELRRWLADRRVDVVTLVDGAPDGSGTEGIVDEDDTYRAWLAAHDCDVVAVRPDFHVWGTALGPSDTIDLLERFADLAGGGASGPVNHAEAATPPRSSSGRC